MWVCSVGVQLQCGCAVVVWVCSCSVGVQLQCGCAVVVWVCSCSVVGTGINICCGSATFGTGC